MADGNAVVAGEVGQRLKGCFGLMEDMKRKTV
jgi:hypothetical protein